MPARYDFSNLEILIVDDNAHTVRVLKTVLASMRITAVRVSDSGPVALRELRNRSPDLIFVDLAGREVNGFRLIRALRRHPGPARHCPVVSCSTQVDATTVRRARDAGADYTLARPFSVQTIFRIMEILRNGERDFVEAGRYHGPDRRRRIRQFQGEDRRTEADGGTAV